MILTCPNCDAKFNIKDGALGTEGRKVKCSKCDHRWHAMPDGADAPAELAAAPEAPEAPEAAAPEPAPEAAAETAAPEPADAPPETDDPLGALDQEPDLDPPPEGAETADSEDDPFAIPETPNEDMLSAEEADAEMRPIPPDSAFEPRQPEPRQSGILGWIIFIAVVVAIITCMIVFRGALVSLYPPLSKVYELVGFGASLPGEGLKLPTPQRSVRRDGDTTILDVSGTIENTTPRPIDVPSLKGILYDSKKVETYHWFFKATQATILPGEKIPYKTEVKNPPPGSVQLVITFGEGK